MIRVSDQRTRVPSSFWPRWLNAPRLMHALEVHADTLGGQNEAPEEARVQRALRPRIQSLTNPAAAKEKLASGVKNH